MTSGAWLFDVDGCLVDSLTGSSLRPLARELLAAVTAAGCEPMLWSAGGADYARRVAERHGLTLVRRCYGKAKRGRDGRWVVPAAGCPVVVCVDDRPEDAPTGVDVVEVSPYVAPDPHDRGLADALAMALVLARNS